jgi:hypothetical protein
MTNKREVKELGPFQYWTEHYYGSKKTITTISWKGHGEVDSNEVQNWCTKTFGKSGYQEEINDSLWIDNIEKDEIMLCREEYLTLFLLRWG